MGLCSDGDGLDRVNSPDPSFMQIVVVDVYVQASSASELGRRWNMKRFCLSMACVRALGSIGSGDRRLLLKGLGRQQRSCLRMDCARKIL